MSLSNEKWLFRNQAGCCLEGDGGGFLPQKTYMGRQHLTGTVEQSPYIKAFSSQEDLEIIESLPQEQQENFINIIRRRLIE
ncbi:MAG: hypothetical protein STSR0004_14020 [Peptococcaceae bacterium]